MRYTVGNLSVEGPSVTDMSAYSFGLVLKPDRRQLSDRRRSERGGRRAADRIGFTMLAASAEDEELAHVVAVWGELLQAGSRALTRTLPAEVPRATL